MPEHQTPKAASNTAVLVQDDGPLDRATETRPVPNELIRKILAPGGVVCPSAKNASDSS